MIVAWFRSVTVANSGRFVLKVLLRGFADWLRVGCEKKRKVKDTTKVFPHLSNWRNGVILNYMGIP